MKHATITRRKARPGLLADDMRRYRALSWGHWIGPWRWTRDAAERDAVRAGEAYREVDEDRVYLAPACEIATGAAAGPVRPHAVLYALAYAEFDALAY